MGKNVVEELTSSCSTSGTFYMGHIRQKPYYVEIKLNNAIPKRKLFCQNTHFLRIPGFKYQQCLNVSKEFKAS